MSPLRRGIVQGRILDGVKAADPTMTDAALARAMECCRTEISRFRSGERAMDLDELAGLLASGADPRLVLGPLAEIGGARIELEGGDIDTDVQGNAIQLVEAAAGLASNVHLALRGDRRVDATEARAMLPKVDALSDDVAKIGAFLRRVLRGAR